MSILQTLVGPVAGILDKFIEDKDQKAKLAHEIATMAEKHAHESAMAQVDVNKSEAQHRSIFVAGWRPFIGWICGIALAYHFVVSPIILFVAGWAGAELPELCRYRIMKVAMLITLEILEEKQTLESQKEFIKSMVA